MDRLPKEIVLLIISEFSFHEKLQCALVCRKWLNWIQGTNLYSNIHIAYDNERHRACLDFFEEHDYGRLVSSLRFENCDSTLMGFLQLPVLFPNLKYFTWQQYHDEDGEDYLVFEREVKDKFYERRIQKWKHLETIKEQDIHFPMTTALLKSPSSAASLRHISITCPQNELVSSPDDMKQYQTMSILLKNIQNSPELLTLELENILVTWNNMDRLHDKLKKLKSITFKNMFLRSANEYSDEEDNGDEYSVTSVDLGPAESLETFNIDYECDVFESERGNIYWWIRYMAKKYKNITSFSLTFTTWIYMPITATSFEETFEFCLPCWPRLKQYNVKTGGLTKRLLDVMDNNRIALEDLTIYIDVIEEIFQFRNLMASKQAESIKTLRIVERCKLADERGYGIDMLALIQRMPKLQHLHFAVDSSARANSHNVSLMIQVLNSALNIESLSLSTIAATPPALFTPLTHSTKLRYLGIFYFQFCCDNYDIATSNQIVTNVLNNSPFLESFEAKTNFYEAISSNSVIEFDFTKNPCIKTIQIDCLCKSTYRIIRAGKTDYYTHTEGGHFVKASPEDISSPFITIKLNNHARVSANILLI